MTAHRASASDAGFVLVGVVVFVLALTILVLSLYGLSSYEAQFLERSLNEEQAFQSAVGGIERARYALSRSSLLASVRNDLPPGVVATLAIQVKGSLIDSVGPVDWLGNDVTLRVTADVRGARRTVEARFSPLVTQSYYSSLLTVSEGIEVRSWGPWPWLFRQQTVRFDGPVWESSAQDTNAWKPELDHPQPVGIRKSPAVPLPDVAPYLDPSGPYLSSAPLVVNSAGPPPANPVFILDASGTPGVPVYFTADNDAPDHNFSFTSFPRPGCTIQVHGIAVWLLPRGAMFYQGTVITGDPDTDCLVVIAGPMHGSVGWSAAPGPTSSICSLGYLRADIPVVLVSSGEVLLWHENDPEEDSFATDLAIFARSAEFMGPAATAHPHVLMHLRRDPNGRLSLPSGPRPAFLDALGSHGALPNSGSLSERRLDLVPGTWQASDR